jgi:hypothetical protein
MVYTLLTILFAGNDGLGSGLGQLCPHVVRVVGPVGQYVLPDPQVRGKQRRGLGAIAGLAAGQGQLVGPAPRVATQVQLATEATSRAAERLRPVFLSAPAACWYARTLVEATSNSCRPLSSCKLAKTLVYTPLFCQREKRANTVD